MTVAAVKRNDLAVAGSILGFVAIGFTVAGVATLVLGLVVFSWYPALFIGFGFGDLELLIGIAGTVVSSIALVRACVLGGHRRAVTGLVFNAFAVLVMLAALILIAVFTSNASLLP